MANKPKLRYFEGVPVREGRGDILVQPSRDDIKKATKHDPANCAYAVCLKRMLQTSRVFIYQTIAYIETLDEKGNPWMERYWITNHAHAYIKRFDAGEDVGPGGFILEKPKLARTLEYKRRQSKKFADAHPAKVREYARKAYAKQRTTPKPRVLTGSFRNGTGQVHFVGTEYGYLEQPEKNI